MTDLDRCRFCGSREVYLTDDDGWRMVLCPDCGAQGPRGDDDEQATYAWNRRGEPTGRDVTTGDHIQVRITEISHAKPSAVYEVAEPPERIYIVPGERDYYTSRHGSWLKGYEDALVEYVRKEPDKVPTRAQLAEALRDFLQEVDDNWTPREWSNVVPERVNLYTLRLREMLAAYDKETP